MTGATVPAQATALRWLPWLAATVAAALYLPATGVPPVGDDWQIINWAIEHGSDVLFEGRNFRLWERIVAALTVNVLGPLPGPMVALSIGVVLASAATLHAIVRRLAPDAPAAAPLATAPFLLHPANVSAAIQIDTFAQSLSVLLTMLTVRYALWQADWTRWQAHAALGVWVLATVLAKETALGAMAFLPVALGMRQWLRGGSVRDSAGFGLRIAAAVATALAVYLAVRGLGQSPLAFHSTERYSVHFAPALLAWNTVQLLGCALFYGDTLAWFVHRDPLALALSAFLSIALAAAVAWHAWPTLTGTRGRGRFGPPDRFAWFGFAFASLVPAITLGSVSELYAASLTPFVASAFGLAFAPLVRSPRQPSRALAWIVVVAALAWGALAIHRKETAHASLAQRTWTLLEAVVEAAPDCTFRSRDTVVEGNLRDTNTGGLPYSVFSATNVTSMRRVLAALRTQRTANWMIPAVRQQRGTDAGVSCTAEPPVGGTCVLACTASPHRWSVIERCRPLREDCGTPDR